MKEYPDLCNDCKQLETCKQKQFMLANTKPVQGFVQNADVWCKEHTNPGLEDMVLCYTIIPLHGESDTPCHCANCGRPLDCELTDDGVEYVKEQLADGCGCCAELWPVLFADYL